MSATSEETSGGGVSGAAGPDLRRALSGREPLPAKPASPVEQASDFTESFSAGPGFTSEIEGPTAGAQMRGDYERQRAEIRRSFELNGDGLRCARARAALVDGFVQRLWLAVLREHPSLREGVTIAAVGGYGRGQLFPFSDVDLFFCVEKGQATAAKAAIRSLSQSLWDCGMQVSLTTRAPGSCERFDPANAEFALSLLDLRYVSGDEVLFARLRDKAVARMRSKDAKSLAQEVVRLTRERHDKYGHTLFHLEPNIKDGPGGLRDAQVGDWLRSLRSGSGDSSPARERDFFEALGFLAAVRCFLHYRHDRDDNVMDWRAQDAAAEQGIGLGSGFSRPPSGAPDASARIAAAWMRAYFRYARVVQRRLLWQVEESGLRLEQESIPRRWKLASQPGLRWSSGRLQLEPCVPGGVDAAHEPETVLAVFVAMAQSGARLSRESEERIADAVPLLSSNLEDFPALWRSLAAILTGERVGVALRAMHTLGVLELILPEFHGIDALVIRDAYHRYTVDEHTFVLIDILHGLRAGPGKNAPEWRIKFGSIAQELHNPALLYLAALLHDTGKGRAGSNHAQESAKMAAGVTRRLELDSYDSALVIRLIEIHLEMSAALRRDIFDVETVHTFAGKVQTHEMLRMLTLFTYADIAAVHPDALTPWKAENLWRLSMSTANQLDRNVDEDRVHALGHAPAARQPVSNFETVRGEKEQKIARVLSLAQGREREVQEFLEGFPARYISTREPQTIQQHFELTRNFAAEPFQIVFQNYSGQAGPAVSEITLVTKDRPRLFADMAAALAAWGMNVVTADAFANAAGVVVDSFRFTDTFRTLELNESERARFVSSVRDLIAGRVSVESLLSGRRRARRPPPRIVVETKIEFDDTASLHSTLLQVIAQDVPGLLRTVSRTLNEQRCNVEVALIDTEGEMAIDVFYLTTEGLRLSSQHKDELRQALLAAVRANAG